MNSDETTGHLRGPLALLGAGAMGSAILEAVLAGGQIAAADVRITTLDPAAADRWRERGVHVADDNAAAVAGARLVIVAVKPADVPTVLDSICAALPTDAAAESAQERCLVVSIAAGVRLATLAQHLPPGTPAVRVMPNTPALIGEGMSALSPGEHAGERDVAMATALLAACGQVVVVPEKQQDAVTAISGSGPAYVFAVAEALIDAGVLLGLPRPTAAQLATQTLAGAALMLRESGQHPSLLREQVTSPGGTTAAGLREFDRHALKSTIIAAAEAAHERSRQLGG